VRPSRVLLLLCAAALISTFLPLSASVQVRVTSEVANLRLRPDIGSAIILQIPRGTLLLTTAKEGDWYLVSVRTESGRTETGYVHESLVTPLAPQVEPGPAEQPPPVTRPEPQSRVPEKTPAPRKPSSSFFSREKMFSINLAGGLSLVRGGDLNLGARGVAAFYQDSLSASAEGSVAPVRFGYAGGADILLPLAEKISLGLGVEFLRSSRESTVLLRKGSEKYSYTARPSVWDLPLRALIDFAPVAFLHLKLGVEYHFAQAGYFYRWETTTGWQEWTGDASGRGLGVYGGLGLEWPLSPVLSLVVDLAGRYAPITNFSGIGTTIDSNGISAEEEGKLYYYETRIAGRAPYALLLIRSRVPSEGGVYNPRVAEVDFTGLALRAGFKLTF